MVLVIVYDGAVAVMFLFVVMMLDVNFAAMREGFQRYAPIGALVALILFVELAVAVTGSTIAPGAASARLFPTPDNITNSQALGSLIYTNYLVLFQLAGVILLVAMIGAIVLTHRDRKRAKRQDLAVQHARLPADTLTMVSAKLGAGAPMPKPEKETL
jgi:NADH-quinone oxidoreductase subunit J